MVKKSSDLPQGDVQKTPRLSKSKYISGLQCHKRLYLDIYQPYLATPPDAGTQAILDMGTEVGELARRRFPGGRLVTAGYRQIEAALAQTAALMADESIPAIYEAAIMADGVLVRVDILERVATEDGALAEWRLIEVKSSTKVKDVHLDDLALQRHVLVGAGLNIVSCHLMRINTAYTYAGGEVELNELFAIDELSTIVLERQVSVPDRIAAMKTMLLSPAAPVIDPDRHCFTPYECPFWAHCTSQKPARWIFHLPGAKQIAGQLAEQGVVTIDEIPDGAKLSVVQRKVKENVEWVSEKLEAALKAVRFPVHHLDFETVMLAVPRFAGTRPYQALPVQWSNHIEQDSGELVHHEFLHTEGTDPRKALAESLLDSLGSTGSICVYSPYEKSVIEQLAEFLPERRTALKALVKRIWDLHPVVKDYYYHPEFGGSYSLKEVLPALVPSLRYDDLNIREGGQAASEYYKMVFVETDWIERAKIQEALLAYCKRDTLAMVELRRVLGEKAKGQ
ncbi:MAG: hypothetical protein BVN29_13470 [Nitrospira sp. ST-bin5]|nr:MAG: hypothetical protein BVN29_13470 [Nitrospira sp. ST-bin5]